MFDPSHRKLVTAAAPGALIHPLGGFLRRVIGEILNIAGSQSDCKALVCAFLAGGSDSFNMVAPRVGAEHDEYLRARQNLAVARAALVPVDPVRPDASG